MPPVGRRQLLVACLLVLGCGAPAPSGPVPVATTDPDVVTPSPTVNPTAVADAATFGPWRRRPVVPSPQVAAAAEVACRALPAVGTRPLLVSDVRGEGILTLVFADPQAAAVCHAHATGDGKVTADARTMPSLAGTAAPADGKLGPFDIEEIGTASGSRLVVVGRVAEVPGVEMSFDDATWGKASLSHGWYAAWWPAAALALSVASVDNRSVVIDSYPVP
jgi:hypothetical protein